jgi:beta-glucosidase/6-phospho-beta-glucosidase/beta-galactosidase
MASHAGDRFCTRCSGAEWEYARSVQWFMDPIFKGRYPQKALDRMDMSQFHTEAEDMNIIHQPIDFLGVNYYTREFISTDSPPKSHKRRWVSRIWAGRFTHWG